MSHTLLTTFKSLICPLPTPFTLPEMNALGLLILLAVPLPLGEISLPAESLPD